MHIQCLSKCHLLFLVGPFWYVTISPLSPRLWHESGPARPICGEPANINKSLHGRSVLTLNPNAPGLVYACLSQVIGYSEAQHTSGGQSTYRKPKLWNIYVFFCRKSKPLNSGNSSGKLKTQGHTMGNSPSNSCLLLLSKVAVPSSALSLGTNELVQSVFESCDARNALRCITTSSSLVATHNSYSKCICFQCGHHLFNVEMLSLLLLLLHFFASYSSFDSDRSTVVSTAKKSSNDPTWPTRRIL